MCVCLIRRISSSFVRLASTMTTGCMELLRGIAHIAASEMTKIARTWTCRVWLISTVLMRRFVDTIGNKVFTMRFASFIHCRFLIYFTAIFFVPLCIFYPRLSLRAFHVLLNYPKNKCHNKVVELTKKKTKLGDTQSHVIIFIALQTYS